MSEDQKQTYLNIVPEENNKHFLTPYFKNILKPFAPQIAPTTSHSRFSLEANETPATPLPNAVSVICKELSEGEKGLLLENMLLDFGLPKNVTVLQYDIKSDNHLMKVF